MIRRALAVLVCTVVAMAISLPPASAEKAWSFDDRPDDVKAAVDVLWSKLDVHVKGHYRIRVYGREFLKNATDMVRIYLDTARPNNGPEYRVSWYLGRNPARPIGTTYLTRADSWNSEGAYLKCPGIRHKVNFGTDVITLLIPKRCLGKPEQVRWAGAVINISRVVNGSLYGYVDYFPARNTFTSGWVA